MILSIEPNWISSPGDTINDILKNRNIEISVFAKKIQESNDFVIKILNGSETISETLAGKLATELGASKSFWINREKQYRELLQKKQAKILEDWVKLLPVKDMLRFGWINKSENLAQECLDFFGVKDVFSWQEKYNTGNLAFKKTDTFKSEMASIVSWIRKGEILANKYPFVKWNKEKFLYSLDEIKKLTRIKDPKRFLPRLIELCYQSGVVLTIVPTPKGCPVSGAVKFLDGRALMQMSFRYLSDDQFWFAFFHEAGHLVLHNPESVIYETLKTNEITQIEKEANEFAREALIPYYLSDEFLKIRGNKKKIVGFSIKAGVSPGIVVGQLQHQGVIKFEYLNGYKRRYNWEDINETLKELNFTNL